MGAKVAKHGNRSVSSKSGASDVLTALGVNVNVTPEQARQALDDIGVCFLFAQQYHSGFKHVAPVRAALKTRTLFNILGPLINPARPTYHLLGVYAPELVKTYAETAVALGHQHTFVVHGAGLDEVAVHGETQVAEIKNGKIDYFTLTPEDFGLKTQSLESLHGGEPQENAQYLTALLQIQQLPNDIWQAIGKLIRQLHDLQICHTDLNAHNILVQQLENEQKCWLIDFDKCGQTSGDSWKQGNLERLHRSFVKEVGRMNIQFNEENWTELLKGYNH